VVVGAAVVVGAVVDVVGAAVVSVAGAAVVGTSVVEGAAGGSVAAVVGADVAEADVSSSGERAPAMPTNPRNPRPPNTTAFRRRDHPGFGAGKVSVGAGGAAMERRCSVHASPSHQRSEDSDSGYQPAVEDMAQNAIVADL